MIYWLIGQPGCGKTTLARRLKKEFDAKGNPSIHLDGDDLRHIFAVPYDKKESFSKEYRIEQTRVLQRMVAYMADQGVDVIVSTVNPYRVVREEFKNSRKDVREFLISTSDTRGREDKWAKDFEEPLTNYTHVITGGKQTEEDSFRVLYSYL